MSNNLLLFDKHTQKEYNEFIEKVVTYFWRNMQYQLKNITTIETGNLLPKEYYLTIDEKKELSKKGCLTNKSVRYAYTPDVFEYDNYRQQRSFGEEKYLDKYREIVSASAGDIVVSLITQYAAIVREGGNSLMLTPNYAKISINNEIVSKEYFVLWFNEIFEARKQIIEMKQGTTVIKLSPKNMRDMMVSLPSLKQQKTLGRMYFQNLELTEKMLMRHTRQLDLIRAIEQKIKGT